MSDAQAIWAKLLVASLVEAGVEQALISPGARSTPLAWAALRTPGLRSRCFVDERSAGFYALGQARVSGLPSLLICTSGSALCHYYPAVVEARAAGLPVVVLSADRPFELADCGAPQTMDQCRAFGPHARFLELGSPESDRDSLLSLRRKARQAVEEAMRGGAVQLNFRARKPLEPSAEIGDTRLPELPLGDAGPVQFELAPAASGVPWVAEQLRSSLRPLLICGALRPQHAVAAATMDELVRCSGTLLHLEAASQLRFGELSDAALAFACDANDWVLGHPALAEQLRPDFILQIGSPPMCTALQRLLSEHPAIPFAVCSPYGRADPFHKSARVVRGSPASLLSAVCRELARVPRAAPTQSSTWLEANAKAREVVDAQLAARFGEARAACQVVDRAPPRSVLCVGNSLAPRHLDRYRAAARRGLTVLSQRGVNGIDGGVAAALGAASLADSPVTAVLGDVSFLHDVGSLWAASAARLQGPAYRHPVVIVVLNNGGGRIFEQLPLARRAEVDLAFWTSPHELELSAAAQLYGVRYARAETSERLDRALDEAYARAEVSLIEVVVPAGGAQATLAAVEQRLDGALKRLATTPSRPERADE